MANRRLILGTAGHVDHGKTQLVNRLTGWDTDRLKEEKARGISIELGFAPLRLDDEAVLGIVDVPGHERFVKHMVAGAGGIDLALLVIAADEGVMPQTREHLEVLRSLAVAHGVVVITKADLADELVAILEEEIVELVEGTFLQNAPVIEASAKTGQGIDELKSVLKQLAEQVPEKDTGGPFRLAVDRVFHKQGIGVVVTGSCYSGTVAVGDSLELLPANKAVRVRDIQSFGEKRQHGYAGERLAIALQGRKLGELLRGEMLVTPSKFVVSHMLDARVHVAGYTTFELKQRERVRLHHGSREVLGRVVLLEADKLRSGDDSLVQFRLETPVVAGEGDYFVIRKYSPARVLGGGRIIDPGALKHRRRDATVIEDLRLREAGDPKQMLLRTIESAGLNGAKASQFDAGAVQASIEAGTVIPIEDRLYHAEVLTQLADEIQVLTREYVAAHPLRGGFDKEELRQRVRFPHATPMFNRVLDRIAGTTQIYVRDNLVRSDTEHAELPSELSKDVDTLARRIREAGLLFGKTAELEKTWRSTYAFLDALQFLRDRGDIEKIGVDGYIHVAVLEPCLAQIRDWFNENAELTVNDFKSLFDMTRKHAIPLLEHLDENRMTIRRGNVRVRGPRL